MPENQTIVVTQKNEGCLSGCGTVLGVLLLVGLAVQYWYIAVPLAVVGAGTAFWYHTRQADLAGAQPPLTPPAPGVSASLASAPCANCGQPSSGNFCNHCGAARGRSCSGCSAHGLDSPFCPSCGAATYQPPS